MLLFMTGQQKSVLRGTPDWFMVHGCLFQNCTKSKAANVSRNPIIPHMLINSGISDSVSLFSVQEAKELTKNSLLKTGVFLWKTDMKVVHAVTMTMLLRILASPGELTSWVLLYRFIMVSDAEETQIGFGVVMRSLFVFAVCLCSMMLEYFSSCRKSLTVHSLTHSLTLFWKVPDYFLLTLFFPSASV